MLRKICEVFTKEYRKETEYREFVSKMIHCFKLNDNGEDIEDKEQRFTRKGSNWGENIPLFNNQKKKS